MFLYRKILLSIEYAGGNIAFDVRWFQSSEGDNFIRNIHLAKDKLYSTTAIDQGFIDEDDTGDEVDGIIEASEIEEGFYECPHCGNAVELDVDTCHHCKEDIGDKTSFCYHCGETVIEGASFCKKCGGALTE